MWLLASSSMNVWALDDSFPAKVQMSPSSPSNTWSGFSQQYPGTNFCLSQDFYYCDKDHSQNQPCRYFFLFLGNSVIEGNVGRNWYVEPGSRNWSRSYGEVLLLIGWLSFPSYISQDDPPKRGITTVCYDVAHQSLIMFILQMFLQAIWQNHVSNQGLFSPDI